MRTDENRARYDRSGLRYPSDLIDEEWELIAPLIPPAKRGGNKRTVVERDVVNGVMFILSTGCQWASLPKDLPPRSTVNDYFFRRWGWDGTLGRIHHALHVECRELAEREASPMPCIPEAVCNEFSRRTRDAQSAAREHAARGGRDWDARPEEARVAFLKGDAKASRQGKGDDLADADAWRAQAAAMGWSHRSAVRGGRPSPPPLEADRIAAARAVAVELLGRELERRAVLAAGDGRAAARGLISTGAASYDDVLVVTRALARDGVVQGGRRTALIWHGGGPEDGRARVTTALYRDQEEELLCFEA